MLEIEVSRRAAADLKAIFKDSLKKWGERQAVTYLRSLSDEIDKLCRFPEMGRNLPIHNYRAVGAGPHFIVYRVIGPKLRVVRILHESMDIKSHL